MITEIRVEYKYGFWSLSFTKTIDLPFTPLPGIVIADGAVEIHLTETSCHKVYLYYRCDQNKFKIYSTDYWQNAVDEEEIDSYLESYTVAGWKMETTEKDLASFRKFMKSQRDKNTRA